MLSPTIVQRYLKMANEDSLGVHGLLRLENPELNHRFNGGNPAYCDGRFEDFKRCLPHFEQELKKPHMTTHLLWEEYRKDVPEGYWLTLFRVVREDIYIEKELTWWQRFRLRLGSVSLVLIVIAMLYLFLKFTNLLNLKL